MIKPKVKVVIGTTDHIDLPAAMMLNIPCKIDTGADTSSFHCERIHLVEKDGVEHLSFVLLDKSWPQYTGEWINTTEFKEKKIKSSFGDYEFRYQVRILITLFDKTYKSRFTLTNRAKMKYPILLGKAFLKNRYLVDVSLDNINLKRKTQD